MQIERIKIKTAAARPTHLLGKLRLCERDGGSEKFRGAGMAVFASIVEYDGAACCINYRDQAGYTAHMDSLATSDFLTLFYML